MNTSYKILGKALELANAFGFLYPAEVFLLQAVAQTLRDGAVAVVLGAGAGTSSLAIAEMKPSVKIFSVDISEGGPLGGLLNERNAFDNANISPYPTQILGDTTKVHARWDKIGKGKVIDLLFIDADHSSEALTKDITGWLPHIGNLGYVIFHDYDSKNWKSVKDVVDELIKPPLWRRVLLTDTLYVFQRTK